MFTTRKVNGGFGMFNCYSIGVVPGKQTWKSPGAFLFTPLTPTKAY